jgi:hypothetical protein
VRERKWWSERRREDAAVALDRSGREGAERERSGRGREE